MSAATPERKSFGEELLSVIRAEIADYDARKTQEAEVERLKQAARTAAIKAESAEQSAKLSGALLSGVLFGKDPRAASLDAFSKVTSREQATKQATTFNINAASDAPWGTATDVAKRFADQLRRRHDAQWHTWGNPQVNRLTLAEQAEPTTFAVLYKGTEFTFALDGQFVGSARIPQHNHNNTSPSSVVSNPSVGERPGPVEEAGPGHTTDGAR